MTTLDNLLVVVDTSVVSLICNRDPRSRFYQKQMEGKRAIISFQTWEEMLFGTYKGEWGDRRKSELAQYLQQYTVVWPTPELVNISANLRSESEAAGRRLATADAWIAATAILLNCPLASHDRDFSGIPNLRLLSSP